MTLFTVSYVHFDARIPFFVWSQSSGIFAYWSLYVQYRSSYLEKSEKLLLWLFILLGWSSLDINTLHAVYIGSLVVLSKLWSSSDNSFRWSPAGLGSCPVQTFSVSKDGDTLLLLVTSTLVFLVASRPLLLFGSLDVRVVPALKLKIKIRSDGRINKSLKLWRSRIVLTPPRCMYGMSSRLSSPFLILSSALKTGIKCSASPLSIASWKAINLVCRL